MLVAVTGASGFIGRHVVDRLASTGVNVRAIVRAQPRLPINAPAIVAPLDVASLTDAFRGASAVVHLAGVVSTVRRREFRTANVDGTRAVAVAAATVGARLVHISSLAVAGPTTADRPSTESDAPRPLTPYGRSKLEGEHIVQSIKGLRWTILRPGAVYGPGDRAMLPLFEWARTGMLPLVGHRDAGYTFVYVSDVVHAIDAALRASTNGDLLFVGHPQFVRPIDLVTGLGAALNKRIAAIRVPDALAWPAAVVAEGVGRAVGKPLPLNLSRFDELSAPGFVCSVDRLRERLNIVAEIDLARGLAETAEWYRREGWIR